MHPLQKRVEAEVKQIVTDIQRIKPEGELHCAFGDLFTDPKVEQYYEALVGTLKAAKKKGLIQFKGQILLKGMHDQVQVSVVNADANAKVNAMADVNANDDGSSHSSNNVDKNNGKAGHANSIGIRSGRSKAHNVQMRMNARKGSRIRSNYSFASKQILPPGNTSINTSVNTTPSGKNDTQTQTSDSGTKQALLTPTHIRGQKNSQMSQYTPTPTSARDSSRHAHADVASIHSFASVPTPTMIRSPLPKSMLKIDVMHSNKAGTTFRSNSNAETHEERVDREVRQLVLDIKRIQPEGEEYCAFGDLFDDELVEQVSCSVMDTILICFDRQQTTSVNRVFLCVCASMHALAYVLHVPYLFRSYSQFTIHSTTRHSSEH